MKKIVTVQDISCYGQCSITVALPILSAYGIETAILPSAVLSTHTAGFEGFTCLDLTDEMQNIVNHWKKENITFDGIYTGYIGDAKQFDIILELKNALNPGGLLIVDPAMADNGKLYPALNDTIVEGMRKITREADVVIPNLTEAAFLLNEPVNLNPGKAEVTHIVKELAKMGPEQVILTGVSYDDGKIGAVMYEKSSDKMTEYFTEKKVKSYHGTGDIFSSVLIAALLDGRDNFGILKEACEFTADAIERTIPDDKHAYGVKFEQVLADKRNN